MTRAISSNIDERNRSPLRAARCFVAGPVFLLLSIVDVFARRYPGNVVRAHRAWDDTGSEPPILAVVTSALFFALNGSFAVREPVPSFRLRRSTSSGVNQRVRRNSGTPLALTFHRPVYSSVRSLT